MRRGEVGAEDSPAAAGTLAVGDNRVEVGIPVVVEGNPAAAEDSRVGEGSLRAVEGNPAVAGTPVVASIKAAEDTRAEGDNRVGADTPGVAEDSPVAAGTPAAEASRRKSCHTWRRRCCPGLQGSGNWGRRLAEVCRTHCSISVRGRYWRRTWGILSIVAFHLSVTSITICKGKIIPVPMFDHLLDYIHRY